MPEVAPFAEFMDTANTLSDLQSTHDESLSAGQAGGTTLPGYLPTVTVTTRAITVQSNGNGQGILISVKDNGKKIPPKILEKIFHLFFTTKPAGEGPGLGLSLSYDIVKAHGGEINVETKESGSAEFIVQLPAG